MTKALALLSALLAASTSGYAIECEPLKAEIDQKFKSNGATNYTLVVTELAVSARGKPVGTCENGSKRIYYIQGGAGAGNVSQAKSSNTNAGVAVKPGPRGGLVLTECKAGFSGPDCKTREKVQ
jgi:hypothetical protein